MNTITIRKSGNLIDISPDGNSALPAEVRKLLEPELTYTYIKQLYGAARFDPDTGRQKSIQFETRYLFKIDGKGRMICGYGMFSKIKNILLANGYAVTSINKDPLKKDINCYKKCWDIVNSTFNFRPKQLDCLKAIANKTCGVIDAPTGFGKGIIIAMICLLYPYAKIHIVTPGKDLIEKTVRTLLKFIPNIGQVGIGQNHTARVTVYSPDSLHLSDGEADILIGDEGHELMAPTYSTSLARYRYSRNYCFTATPKGRGDNADLRMESLFGPVIFHMTYQEAVDLGLVVPIEVHWIDTYLDFNPVEGKSGVTKKRWGIWRNDERNTLIAKEIEKYLDDQVLILVDTIEHAVYLKKQLPMFQLSYDKMAKEDRNFYIKQKLITEDEPVMTPQRREQMRLDFESGKLKHVIATGVWATGVSFDALPVLCWAAGGQSQIKSTQVPGRVCRIHHESGKNVGILLDCCDQFDNTFSRHADIRSRHYAKHNWKQIYQDGRIQRRKRADI